MKHTIASLLLPVALMGMTSSCALLNGTGACQCGYNGQCGYSATAATLTPAHTGVQQPKAETDSVSKAYLQELLNTDYSLKQYLPEEPKRMVWIDDTLTITEDEVLPKLAARSQGGATRYLPQGVTVGTDNNDVFFHFTTAADGTPEPLHLRAQYYADDPLYFSELLFTIDGFDYSYKPANVQQGKLKGNMYWENSDDALTAADKDLVYALAHCKYWAQITFKGRGNMNHVKPLSPEQIERFASVLALYRLKGGTF